MFFYELFKFFKKKKTECNHRISYPGVGYGMELDNLASNPNVKSLWLCDKCSRFVVEVEKI